MAEAPSCCPVPVSTGAAAAGGDALPAASLAGLDGIEVPAVGLLYAQLLGLGLVMISVHCAGMCGPIVLSLRFGVQQEWRRGRLWLALGQLGAYQAGRGLVYGLLGAVVGGLASLAGAAGGDGRLGEAFATASRWLILVVAIGFILAALLRLRPQAGAAPARPGLLARVGARVARSAGGRPLRRAGMMGLIMAFIPCMIPLWTLGLAAVSASPLHGALLMLLLVAMTTPALLPFAIAPGLLPRFGGRIGFRLQTAALLFSGLWLSLIGLAANELIPHAHTPLGAYTIKWW